LEAAAVVSAGVVLAEVGRLTGRRYETEILGTGFSILGSPSGFGPLGRSPPCPRPAC